MNKEQIIKILKAHFVYSKTAEKIADEIMEMDKHDLGCEIQHTGKCNCKDENYEQPEELTEEQKQALREMDF